MKYFLFGSLIILFACVDTNVKEELIMVRQQLETANKKITQLETEGKLVHLVFFKIKPDTDQVAIITEVKKLKNIKEVLDLEIGPFEDLGDARALSEYTILLQMSFADKAAYEVYQKHPIHLALQRNIGPFMAGPPATYDFIKK